MVRYFAADAWIFIAGSEKSGLFSRSDIPTVGEKKELGLFAAQSVQLIPS